MGNKIVQKVKKAISEFFGGEKSIFWVLIIVSLFIAIQKVFAGTSSYNNYIIFKTSFFHLYYDYNLYRYYFYEYADIYLYSPTFALLMAPLVFLPLALQVILWCCFNAIWVYIAIKLLPVENNRKRIFILWFILIAYITSLQNMQVAPMVASFIILAYIMLEKRSHFWAAFFVVLASFIKIYAIGAVLFFLMYPGKIRSLGYLVLWGVIFLAAPLIFVPYHQLLFQYHSWYNVTMVVHGSEEAGIDPNILVPLSVMGWLKTWFHFTPPAIYIQLAGTVLLCLPFIRVKCFKCSAFRMLLLSSLLIWAMIFNHIAETASYIVTVLGVALWYVTERKSRDRACPVSTVLMISVFIFTILSPTSLFPQYVRYHFIIPYTIKAVPCIIVWFYLQYRLLSGKFSNLSELKVPLEGSLT